VSQLTRPAPADHLFVLVSSWPRSAERWARVVAPLGVGLLVEVDATAPVGVAAVATRLRGR